MPKSTHFHQNKDVMSTDKKFRPDDEGILTQEKQEYQGSEARKKEELASYGGVSPLKDERDEADESDSGDSDSDGDSDGDSGGDSGGGGGRGGGVVTDVH